MDISPGKMKLNTVFPHHKNLKKTKISRRSNKMLNISDDILDNEKKISKKLSHKFNLDELIDIEQRINKNNNNKNEGNRSFSTIIPQIKKELLKDYKEQIKREKKFRKLIILPNLTDSSQDESGEEDENLGLELYISSESYFIFFFDIIIAIFTFYLIFFIPINLAQRKTYITKEKIVFTLFNIITEVFYILDLIIGFFRSYYNYEYKKIINTNNIIMHYLSTDFFMDLFEAFPSYIVSKNYCYKNIGINVELSSFELTMTIFQMLKSFKILKVLGNQRNRAMEVLHEKIAENYFFEKLFSIFVFLFKIFSFFHVLICIHIFLGWQRYPNWMTHINIFDEDIITKYISSFYFIIETMTTVGYGDIICISSIERFFQLILLSIGIVTYSFIITKFGNYVMKQSKEEIELDKKILELEQIRIQYPLMPFKLYIKIQRYFTKKSKKKNNSNELTTLINNLPDSLRNDMLLVVYRDVIRKFNVFKGCNNTDFIIQMCSAFIQTICEKETILLMEGKKVENIIFVKEGKLVLEAAINLANPSDSYEKYFRVNFKSIDAQNYQKVRNSISNTNSALDNKQIESNNNLTYLEEKLMDMNKIGKGNSFFDKTKTNINISFQGGYDSEEENVKEKTDEIKVGNNYKYLKILDIRNNEHFGDVYMFLDQPAPLTLKVKSRKAKIFILKKKDALSINSIHHNIMNRIRGKSFRNLMSIKKKTLQILKKYIGNKLNKEKRTEIQNTSWFNEKSKHNVLEGITNFLNNSMKVIIGDKSPSQNSPLNMTTNKSILKDLMFKSSKKRNNIDIIREISNTKEDNINSKAKPKFNHVNSNIRFKQKFLEFRKSNEIDFSPLSTKNNNLLSLNYEPKINKNRISNKSLSLVTNSKLNFLTIDKIEKSNHDIKGVSAKKSNRSINSDNNNNKNNININKKSTKKVKFRLDYQKTKSLSKDLKASTLDLYSDTSSEKTKEEGRMTTLNDIYNQSENQIRKKIQSSVQKEKILKLCKAQEEIIQSYEKKLSEKSILKNNNDINKENELKKVKELNNIIYNKLLEYLDTEQETEVEEEKKTTNKKDYSFEKVSSFIIKSAYSNLNNLTKGKIIINNNYKIDIKNLIQNYINEKNKNKNKNRNQMNSFDYLVKNYYNDYKEQDQYPLNKGNTLNKKKVKFMDHHFYTSKNLNNIQIQDKKDKKDKNQSFTSYKIKKTASNKMLVYRNFRGSDFSDKISQIRRKNWKYQSNISNKSSKKLNNHENSNTNSASGFTKFLNSIFSKLKGNEN